MSAEILLKPSEAKSQADRMRTAANDARETFQSLRTTLDTLAESFRGQAQVAFDSRYREWDQGQQQAVEALEGLAKWLDQAADQLSEVDAQMGQSLR